MDDLAAAISGLAEAIAAVTLASGSDGSSRRNAPGSGGRWYNFADVWWWGEWGSDGDWWWWHPDQGWISHTRWISGSEGSLPASGSHGSDMAPKRARRD